MLILTLLIFLLHCLFDLMAFAGFLKDLHLLCSRPIGRIMHIARPSIHPSVPYGLVTCKQKNAENQNWRRHTPRHE